MIHLIWGILSFGVFICFLAICINSVKHIRHNFGRLTALLLVLGLFSFMSKSDDKRDSKKIINWNLENADQLHFKATNFLKIDLDHTAFAKNTLDITYGIEKETSNNIPIRAFSMREGFVSGISWVPKYIHIYKIAKDTFQYQVGGVLEWKILGIVIYPQSKTYEGKLAMSP